MIINLSSIEVNQALSEYVRSRGIGIDAILSIEVSVARKIKGGTATITIEPPESQELIPPPEKPFKEAYEEVVKKEEPPEEAPQTSKGKDKGVERLPWDKSNIESPITTIEANQFKSLLNN